MPFNEYRSLRYYSFQSLTGHGITQAVFTRQGGNSPSPWESLNLGGTVGDDPVKVNRNRELIFESVNRPFSSMFDVWQVHSAKVVCADEPRPPDVPHLKADAILTDRPEVTLFMRFADCVPILLFDPKRRVVGLVHAGWQGTVLRIGSAAVEMMVDRYGSRPADVMAAIGPSIGPDHYEIGEDVIGQVISSFDKDASSLLHRHNGAVKFDLWKANSLVLAQAGVVQVETAGICTACNIEDWYSHRAERGRTGRFGALVSLDY